ncbi:glycoside hydrolase [Pedobacter steynii]|uniref:Glycosyl hydrolase n=1 Tax=Pedobacter steynii TaxID=430522 RepID=A0A1D7QCI6_9SPHI|nr:glycoside hydrolase [Pedobacter steynii]AOM76294.1 glycosyl hydrolase [Pedobacter steynii]
MTYKNLKMAFLAMAAIAVTGSCKQQSTEDLLSDANQRNANQKAAVAGATGTADITVNWDQTYQRIDGFGAFGGRIVPFFESQKRDSIMAYLWGANGLQLNMVRGKVLHTYGFNQQSGVVTIKPAGVDIDVDVNSSTYQTLTDIQKEHLGQLWILKKIKERYQVPIMFASTWTPPLYMKTNPNSESGKWFNGLNFSTSSTAFARYLAGFAKAYQNEGINFYAISPSNEPENVFSDWDASYWNSAHLGEFVTNNLRPALNQQGLGSTKILSSENAAWGTANTFLAGMDRSNVDILAGHGYVEIGELITGKRGLNQNPVTWNYATGNKPVWMTETSDDGGTYDNTIGGGLKLATSMHKFLAECNVNAFVYWLGMLAIRNNESLICTNGDGSLDFPKTYDVMGQFSRYIHAGYFRFGATVQNNSVLKVSAYKDPATGKFSLVAINPGTDALNCTLHLQGFAAGSLISYQTTGSSSNHWQQGTPVSVAADGSFSLTVPAQSVITFTGVKN